jgi:alkylation response protein AidB-like acyl-CoA dehydrogenase
MWFMNEERELMRNAARDFAQNELAPVALEMDAGEAFPVEQFKRAGELGFLGITMPEQYGGLGLDYTTLALVYEEIAKVMPSLCVGMGAHSILAGELLMLLGSEELQKKYLAPAATGEKILACAQTEGVGAMNHEEWNCRAVKQGDEWVINGSKVFCSNLKVADAYIVLCPTSDHIDPKTKEGITAFIVDADSEGLTCGAYEDKLGWHGSATGTLSFSNVHVPAGNLLGMEGKGMMGLLITATNEFMTCGPVGLGMAEAAYDMSYQYAQDRIQQGKSLFDNYQVIRHKLVNMETQIEMLRGFVYTSFAEKDEGKMCLARGRQMKIEGAHVAQAVADDAIQIYGGLGVVRQTGVERFWRDAKVMCIGGASIDALKDDIAGMLKQGIEFN